MGYQNLLRRFENVGGKRAWTISASDPAWNGLGVWRVFRTFGGDGKEVFTNTRITKLLRLRAYY